MKQLSTLLDQKAYLEELNKKLEYVEMQSDHYASVREQSF